MKLSNFYCFFLIFVLACGTVNDQQTTEDTEVADSSETNNAEETSSASETTATDTETNEGSSDTDFILGYWKVISYEIPGMEEIDENMGFLMEKEVFTTSFYDFIIDKSYRLMNNSEHGFGDEEGMVESGTWAISEDQSTLTLSMDITDDVLEWTIKELSPQKIVLSRNSPAYENQEVTMILEPMGE